jgi:hypothetical protein
MKFNYHFILLTFTICIWSYLLFSISYKLIKEYLHHKDWVTYKKYYKFTYREFINIYKSNPDDITTEEDINPDYTLTDYYNFVHYKHRLILFNSIISYAMFKIWKFKQNILSESNRILSVRESKINRQINKKEYPNTWSEEILNEDNFLMIEKILNSIISNHYPTEYLELNQNLSKKEKELVFDTIIKNDLFDHLTKNKVFKNFEIKNSRNENSKQKNIHKVKQLLEKTFL